MCVCVLLQGSLPLCCQDTQVAAEDREDWRFLVCKDPRSACVGSGKWMLLQSSFPSSYAERVLGRQEVSMETELAASGGWGCTCRSVGSKATF